MSLWFLLWFVLSFILLGATFWSTVILIQQKKAWREYAAKKGLVFTPNKFFEPAGMEGVIDGYNVSFFTAVQQNPDVRKNRQLTVMQVNANDGFVDGIACGTSEMLPFLQTLTAISPHDVKVGKWENKYHIRSRNKKAVDAFLTEERVSTLGSILSMPNADILIILDANEGIFRFETPNPLQDAKQIDSVMNKLLARIKKLEPSAEEKKRYASLITKEDSEDISEIQSQEKIEKVIAETKDAAEENTEAKTE